MAWTCFLNFLTIQLRSGALIWLMNYWQAIATYDLAIPYCSVMFHGLINGRTWCPEQHVRWCNKCDLILTHFVDYYTYE